MRSNRTERITRRLGVAAILALAAAVSLPAYAQVKPGDVITKANAVKVQNLVSPGNYTLVQRGMVMDIVPSEKLEWPPPYTTATEKYHAQVALAPDGTLHNYVAGLPFPLLDANDPEMATKLMWNFSYRPLYSDDADLRFPEIASYCATGGDPLSFFTVGHFCLLQQCRPDRGPSRSHRSRRGRKRRALPLRLLSVPRALGVARFRDGPLSAYRPQGRGQHLGL